MSRDDIQIMIQIYKRVIPLELVRLNQWCVWKAVTNEKLTKATKRAYHAGTGKRIYAADLGLERSHSSFADALFALKSGNFDGLGFCFNGSKYVGLDLDCKDSFDEIAGYHELITIMMDSYTEISYGGWGRHIIVKSDSVKGNRFSSNNLSGLSLFVDGCYFALTGEVWPPIQSIEKPEIKPIAWRSREVEALVELIHHYNSAPYDDEDYCESDDDDHGPYPLSFRDPSEDYTDNEDDFDHYEGAYEDGEDDTHLSEDDITF